MSLEKSNSPGHLALKRRADSDITSPCSNNSPKIQRQDREGNQHQTRFWDTLSKVWLSRRALREFDRRRRTHTQREHYEPPPDCEAFIFPNVKEFARRGGPSLAHLRGYASSTSVVRSGTQSMKRFREPSQSGVRLSSLYTLNYKQKLIDSGIYPDGYKKVDRGPANEDDILARMRITRASLSSSKFDEQDFKHFRQDITHASSETETMPRAFSTIEGRDHHHYTAYDLMFTDIKSMTEGLAKAKPDLYDGAVSEDIDPRVRAALHDYIEPSNKSHAPNAPNFFVEGKSEAGRIDIARLQACHDGAIGARAMHQLQNYGEDVPVYDNKAYSFSNTFQGGTGLLQMFGHHSSTPKGPGHDPEYHMTHLESFAMTGSRERFREGATAFRNMRDYAKEQRDSFIDQANQRASTMPSNQSISTPSARMASIIEESNSPPDEFFEIECPQVRTTTFADR